MKKHIVILFCIFSFSSVNSFAQFINYTIVPTPRSGTSYPSISTPRYNSQQQFIPPLGTHTIIPFPVPERQPQIGAYFTAYVGYESNTTHEAEYKLKVGVTNGRVVKIIFNDNGGCVHTGFNNSGYTYRGGNLEKYQVDDSIYYATQVLISYENGSWQRFTIIIT
jgi:hypothetical protein